MNRAHAELIAEPRMFASVQDALLWFLEQRSKRLGRSIDFKSIGTPQNQERIDQLQVTYAALLPCWATKHSADDLEEPLTFARDPEAARAEAERRICELARWYSSAQRGQVRLADELGMKPDACERYCLYIARVLKRRLTSAGLLYAREDAA